MEKITQTSGANTEHRHSKIERFSTLIDLLVQSHKQAKFHI